MPFQSYFWAVSEQFEASFRAIYVRRGSKLKSTRLTRKPIPFADFSRSETVPRSATRIRHLIPIAAICWFNRIRNVPTSMQISDIRSNLKDPRFDSTAFWKLKQISGALTLMGVRSTVRWLIRRTFILKLSRVNHLDWMSQLDESSDQSMARNFLNKDLVWNLVFELRFFTISCIN